MRKPLAARGEHLAVILTEMCDRVGAPTKAMWFKGEERHPNYDNKWYTRYTWTNEEQEEFINWTAEYLRNNLEARKELGHRCTIRKTKKACREWIEALVWNCGWKETL